MDLYEARKLAAVLVASGNGLRLHAEVRKSRDCWRIYFCGGPRGEHSVDVCASDRARVLAHWEGYIAPLRKLDVATLPERIPAISVRQPWAELIASGQKTVECSRAMWAHRGWIVIQASTAYPSADLAAEFGIWPDQRDGLGYGVTVAIAWLADARLPVRGDSKRALCEPGSDPVLVLDDVKRLRHRKVRGHPGMFYVQRSAVVLA